MRRSPTATQLQTWRRFTETSARVNAAMASRLQSDSGISPGDYAVLLALSEAGTMRSSDLAATINWERSRLSHHLGRMEQRGLLRREECLTDNRGAEVALTEAGTDLFRRASAPHMHAIQELFASRLSPEQLNALDDAMRALD
jgi:DNA-binding MarR family transcriptional regulator